ncbi:uncharacterized protein C8A04DRAFT_14688, partial [Dichotomopilus funicola]
AGQTSIDTHPARAPKGKTSRKSGYRSSPLSIQSQPREPATATFAGRSRVKKGSHCRVPRISFINPGNTKEDEYYRNDSLKYCRHEEKKEKRKIQKLAASMRLNTRWMWSVHVCKFSLCRCLHVTKGWADPPRASDLPFLLGWLG